MGKNNVIKMVLAFSLALGSGVMGVGQAQANTAAQYNASTSYSTTTQGYGQWYYGQMTNGQYTDLKYNTTVKRWEGTNGYPWVNGSDMHPGDTSDAARKWVSPGKGTVSLSAVVRKRSGDGDGVVATIRKDSTVLWTRTLLNTADNTPDNLNNIPVEQGTVIYFSINKKDGKNFDQTLWTPTVTFTPASTTPVVDTNSISVTSHGAVANDGKDDLNAFNTAARAAKSQGKTLTIPAGEFILSDVLVIEGIKVVGAGRASTTLVSTNPERGSIDLKGDKVELRNLKHEYKTTVPRGNGAHEKNSITVRSATNFVIDNIHVNRASTAGIMITYGSANGTVSNNLIENTGADGIHMTNSTNAMTVENNVVRAVGDDCIAVVSYKDGADLPVRNITIRGNDVGYYSKARGITVVGGTDVLIENNKIQETQMAGVYISVEGSYNTQDVDRVKVNNNTIRYTGIQQPQNHPNVLVFASQGVIDNVEFNNNMIRDGASRGIGVWGTATIKNITFRQNTLINTNGAATTFTNGIIKLIDNIGF
ncbi:right-handed parallel beta-helix repeat-containing protein [Saccharibacillus kuerlensis]|uniref:Alpha-1,3-glucanase catalytic domain-containing protein n=1 Tax=Saccharibacillus kuerlensis TaxID=459527 RepID=A0ABQ2L9X2_9BACL|nr:right-handed parallel beta-helix repeat-containing protein [Saccharibacillus kuerlensis]GGO06942.1 hypothetical protein GCM10010969_35010 [Saccharibacillus kuerlensis]